MTEPNRLTLVEPSPAPLENEAPPKFYANLCSVISDRERLVLRLKAERWRHHGSVPNLMLTVACLVLEACNAEDSAVLAGQLPDRAIEDRLSDLFGLLLQIRDEDIAHAADWRRMIPDTRIAGAERPAEDGPEGTSHAE